MDNAIRVLLADDNKPYAVLLGEYIAAHAELSLVGIAHDGLQALALIKETEPDILVLDMVMPQLDGIGVLSALACLGLPRNPRVIVLTALGQEDMTRRTLELGAAYYIMKPFDLDVLAERILQVHHDNYRKPDPPQLDEALLDRVAGSLRDLDIPSTVNGYNYLRNAITMAVKDPALLSRITKGLYPAVAAQFDTTPARVERSMRHAIAVCWDDGCNERAVKLFGYAAVRRRGKPTNSEFIGMLAERLRWEMVSFG